MSRKKLLIWRLGNRGFGSEITTMLLAQLYARDNGIDFALSSKYWNAAYQRGWQDYFRPFCEEIDGRDMALDYLFFAKGNLRERVARFRKKWRLSFLTKRRVLLNYDIWPTIWNGQFANRRFAIGSEGIVGDCFDACQFLLERGG